jgi:hypothetical protein
MKNVSLILCLGLVMSGCSMMGSKNAVDRPNGPDTEPYMVQELTTKFNRDGVEVKSECLKRKFTLGCKELSIKSVKATVTVNSNGGTNALGATANRIGETEALARIAEFFGSTVTSDRMVKTIVKSIEKGEDTINNVIKGSVEITEEEALGDTSVRVNANDYERIVTSTVTAFSTRRLVGVGYNKDTIDDQLIRVTAIWTREGEELIRKHEQKSTYSN